MNHGAESGDVTSMFHYAIHRLCHYSCKEDIDSRKEKQSPHSVVLPPLLEALYGNKLKRIVQAGKKADKNQTSPEHLKFTKRKND